MAKINGGYSAVSWGPTVDLTPHDNGPIPEMSTSIPSSIPELGILTDGDPYSGIGNYGSSEIPPAMDSDFSKLEHKLEHKPGVTNPAGLAASIGRKELGQAEMTRRSEEGRKH
jgi:hypothetical protein